MSTDGTTTHADKTEESAVNAREGVCLLREDTPAVAVAREREILWLREVLLDLTRTCRLVQKEPGNALARFLFSSLLGRGAAVRLLGRAGWVDPVLPRENCYDKSLCSELQRTGMARGEIERICHELCAASREAAVRVEALRLNESVAMTSCASFASLSETVHLLQYGDKNQLIWQNEVMGISAPHLYNLQRLYGIHCLDDVNKCKFNRRLFCCLKRYDALGGPTYQCSVTSTTFCTLETAFGAVKECFASPFNHNSALYWSAFPDTDCFFGSQGDFFASLDSRLVQEGGVFFANPPFVEEYLEGLHVAVERVLALSVPVTFAVMLPTWTDTKFYAWMQRSALTQLHMILAAGEHEYVDGRQQMNTTRWRKRHISPFCSSFFILQNELGCQRCEVDDEVRRRVLASFAVRSKR
jgi:hypothetical protein